MATNLLTVKNLSVKYGSIQGVKNITFDVSPGEIVSLVGANGAGKTTILRSLSGLVSFDGSIVYEGKELKGMKPHEIVPLGIAHAPEGRGIFSNLTVTENLSLGSYLRKDKDGIKKDLAKCLELFPRVKERLTQVAGTLSGGEQQMVAICRAMMAHPKLLLLDEPSLGLAPKVVAQIFEIIKELNKMGKTILLVEQNAKQALKISHRAYAIETGEIKLSGRGADLLNNPVIKELYLGGAG